MTESTIASLLATLCEFGEHEEIELEGLRRESHDLHRLIDLGALVDGGVAPAAICPNCEDPHWVTVERSPDGGYRGYCTRSGWQDLPIAAVATYRVDAGWVARTLQEGIGSSGNRDLSSPSDEVKRIGRTRFGPFRCELFFARRLFDVGHLNHVAASISSVIGNLPAIIVTTTEPAASVAGKLPPRVALVRLEDVLDITQSGVAIDEAPFLSALRGQRTGQKDRGVGFSFSPGYRSACWNDMEFEFTDKQALAVEALHEAWQNRVSLH